MESTTGEIRAIRGIRPQCSISRYILRPLLLLLLVMAAGCTAAPPAPDPRIASVHLQAAAVRVAARDYRGAAAEVGQAAARTPEDGELYLLQGALLERAGRPADARDAYGAGLRDLPAEHLSRPELVWRLALVHALKLQEPGRARRLLDRLPPGMAEHEDLLGVLALQEGQGASATAHLELALSLAPNENLASTILYHLSLVHHRAGDESRALASMFQAANQARNHALLGDLELLWEKLSAGGSEPR